VTARHFAEFEGRNISLTQFLAPKAIARAVWVNLRRGRYAMKATGTPKVRTKRARSPKMWRG